MNNEEIKKLLRALSDDAEIMGSSQRVKITFDPDPEPEPEVETEPETPEEYEVDQPEETPLAGRAASSGASDAETGVSAGWPSLGIGMSLPEEDPEDMQQVEPPTEDEPEETDEQLSDDEEEEAFDEEEKPARRIPDFGSLLGGLASLKDRALEVVGSRSTEDEPEEEAVDEEEDQENSQDLPEGMTEIYADPDPEQDPQQDQDPEQEQEQEQGAAAGPKLNLSGLKLPTIQRKERRPMPVEEADFESDAYMFRSAPEDLTGENLPGKSLGEVLGFVGAGVSAVSEKRSDRRKNRKKQNAEAAEKIPENTAEEAVASVPEPEAQPMAETQPVPEAQPEAVQTPGETDIQEAVEEQETVQTQETAQADEPQQPGETQGVQEIDLDEEEEETGKHAGFKLPKAKLPDVKLPEAFSRVPKKGAVIAGVSALAVLIGAITVSTLSNKAALAEKTKNVTADEGLTVTVEQEPTEWTQSGELVLGVRNKGEIKSITVDGEAVTFEGKDKTQISFTTDKRVVNVVVKGEKETRSAQVTASMIDDEAPQLTASEKDGQITLQADDAASGVAGIYYGTYWGMSNVPSFRLYTGPFNADTNSIYSYFAVDQAGNTAVAQPTKLIEAKSAKLDKTELSLFSGQSAKIGLVTEPEDAFVNNLQISGSDDDVATVSDSGMIKAVAPGTMTVHVTADGCAPMECQVTVQDEAEITISAIGDLTLGDDVNFNTQTNFSASAANNGYDFFFANVKDILSDDDATFGNFEGTLTTGNNRQNKTYAFKGDPEFTQILTNGSVDVVTLANNHSSDYGEESLQDTQKYLSEAGIDYCIGDTIAYKQLQGVKTAFIGIYAVDMADKTQDAVNAITTAKEAGAQLVIVAFHWGSEKVETPDGVQQAEAHAAIDAGADLVVGHHPHVLQGVEKYNGKYIAYSLGNFCFGGNSNPSDTDSIIFRETFSFKADGTLEAGDPEVIPVSITSAVGYNNYQPTPVDGDEKARILEKLNTRSAALGDVTF